MPDILDLVEPETLEGPPPRRLPAFFLLNLLGEHLLERPLWTFLNPLVILCLVAAVVLAALGAPTPVSLALIGLIIIRLLRPFSRLYRDVREDYLLIRYGLIVTAHVIGVRTMRTPLGDTAGAYLDCAIPLNRQRTSVGSIWVGDTGEAMRLSAAGKLRVICLPRAPGSWRLYRPTNPGEHVGIAG